MITLEITHSNDEDAIGIYPFLFDSVYIGSSQKADIVLTDKNLPKKFLTIQFVKGTLVIQSELSAPFYFVNGKKMSGVRKLKIGDKINIGRNTIVLKEYAETSSTKDEDLSFYYLKFNKETPEMKFILEFLEDQIVRLESSDEENNNV